MFYRVVFAAMGLAACSSEEINAEPDTDVIAQEAKLRGNDGAGMRGFWRTKEFIQGAHVDLIWVVGKRYAWHVVTAYADEALTMPLLRWDAIRRYELGKTDQEAKRRELLWNDVSGSLVAFVDQPELFAAVGIDDCSLEPFSSINLSLTNCGAPSFPFRDCEMMDFIVREEQTLTFGNPFETDRCAMSPSTEEHWSFQRVRFDRELAAALFDVTVQPPG